MCVFAGSGWQQSEQKMSKVYLVTLKLFKVLFKV